MQVIRYVIQMIFTQLYGFKLQVLFNDNHLFTVLRYQVFLSNINNLLTAKKYQVFPFKISNFETDLFDPKTEP